MSFQLFIVSSSHEFSFHYTIFSSISAGICNKVTKFIENKDTYQLQIFEMFDVYAPSDTLRELKWEW